MATPKLIIRQQGPIIQWMDISIELIIHSHRLRLALVKSVITKHILIRSELSVKLMPHIFIVHVSLGHFRSLIVIVMKALVLRAIFVDLTHQGAILFSQRKRRGSLFSQCCVIYCSHGGGIRGPLMAIFAGWATHSI